MNRCYRFEMAPGAETISQSRAAARGRVFYRYGIGGSENGDCVGNLNPATSGA